MKKYKRMFEASEEEIKLFFKNRTNKHIERVVKYLDKIINSDIIYELNKSILEHEKVCHDKSKFKDPEYEPYIYITWSYRCKDKGIDYKVSDDLNDKMHQATHHHVKGNKHHPEFWSDTNIDLINRSDRDTPVANKVIDATKMPKDYIACMVADWMSMSEEKNDDPYRWAKNNINVRWKFNIVQEAFIYDILDKCWE